MTTMMCVKNYKGTGFLRENTNISSKVDIKVGDIVGCDHEGYLWFKNICFGHKDAKSGEYFVA